MKRGMRITKGVYEEWKDCKFVNALKEGRDEKRKSRPIKDGTQEEVL